MARSGHRPSSEHTLAGERSRFKLRRGLPFECPTPTGRRLSHGAKATVPPTMQLHDRERRRSPTHLLVLPRHALLLSLCACGTAPEFLEPVGAKPEPVQALPPAPDGGGGSGGTSGVALPDAGPPPERPKTPPGSALFVNDQVLEVRLTLDPADLRELEEHGDEEVYLPGRATIIGAGVSAVDLPQIGVRHKGAHSLHRCWDNALRVRSRGDGCEKLSYKLKFDKYDPEQRVDGLKRLNLHASSSDDTRLHELMAYGIFRDFGVDAPRTALAKVYVNDVLEGLFIAVEAVDGRYTKAHFPDGGGDGNLYKEIWPSPLLNPTDLLASLRTNEEVGDVSEFQRFSDAVALSTSASFAQAMLPWVDVEQLLRYIAVDRAIKNWDGIMAFYSPSRPHNFYWYHDMEGSGRFTLIPWDMDNTFWKSDPYMAPEPSTGLAPVPDWNVEPTTCTNRVIWSTSSTQGLMPPRCDRLLDELARGSWGRFVSIADELLAGPFEPTRLVERARHHAALLDPIIADDPVLDVEEWRDEVSSFEETLLQAVEDFQAYAARGLVDEKDL